jgi:hypothetical protein
MIVSTRMLYIIYLQCPYFTDFMNYLIHATPVHPSLCLQYFILLFTIATIIAFILLLLLLFHYYHHYKTVATDKPLWTSLFPGAAELTTYLLRLINILWLPLCRINKFGFYFPQRLLQSSILVGHQVFSGRTGHCPLGRPGLTNNQFLRYLSLDGNYWVGPGYQTCPKGVFGSL